MAAYTDGGNRKQVTGHGTWKAFNSWGKRQAEPSQEAPYKNIPLLITPGFSPVRFKLTFYFLDLQN